MTNAVDVDSRGVCITKDFLKIEILNKNSEVCWKPQKSLMLEHFHNVYIARK